MLNILTSQFGRYFVMPALASAAFSALAAAQAPVPAQAQATASAPVSLTDRDLVWDTRSLPLSEAIAAIDTTAGLSPYAELIIDRCGLHSLNPKLIALLLDMSNTLADSRLANEAARRNRIDAFIQGVARMGDLGRARANEVAKAMPRSNSLESATPSDDAGIEAVARTFVPGDASLQTLSARYAARFGALSHPKSAVIAPAAAPANFLRLPWTLGQNGWSFNGVHTTSGSCTVAPCASPQSSIDFSLGWPAWGADTSAAKVLAAHDGVVTKFSGCNIRVANANGWATNYYHLSGALVNTGDTVYVGQPIAIYANNQAEALCQGGSSTGPHVHFSLLFSGAHSAIDQSEMSGWKVNATTVTRDYDSTCARMYLTRDGITSCAYNGNTPTLWAMHTLPTTMASNFRCALDVDGNNVSDAMTDGVLLARYLLGFRGTNLIAGAVAAGAPRSSAADIEAFMAGRVCDLDGDGAQRGNTDGLLAARLLAGRTGSALSAQAVGAGSARTSGAQIAAFAAGCR